MSVRPNPSFSFWTYPFAPHVSAANVLQHCVEHCAAGQMRYATLTPDSCRCGHARGYHTSAPRSTCNVVCKGSTGRDTCGATGFKDMYAVRPEPWSHDPGESQRVVGPNSPSLRQNCQKGTFPTHQISTFDQPSPLQILYSAVDELFCSSSLSTEFSSLILVGSIEIECNDSFALLPSSRKVRASLYLFALRGSSERDVPRLSRGYDDDTDQPGRLFAPRLRPHLCRHLWGHRVGANNLT